MGLPEGTSSFTSATRSLTRTRRNVQIETELKRVFRGSAGGATHRRRSRKDEKVMSRVLRSPPGLLLM